MRTKPPKSDAAGGSGAKKSKRARRDESEKKFVESRDLLRSADTGAGGGGGAGGMAGLYKPKTADTRQTYEVMLSFIQVGLLRPSKSQITRLFLSKFSAYYYFQ